MKKIFIIAATSVFLAACGSSEGKFVSACMDGVAKNEFNGDKAAQKSVCKCTHEKVADVLDGKQMKLAIEFVSYESPDDAEDAMKDKKGAEFVAEKTMSSLKQCAM